MIKKGFLLSIFLAGTLVYSPLNANWLQTLAGFKDPKENKVLVGSPLYHIKGLFFNHIEKGDDWWFRPMIAMTYHSWSFFYFKNTHKDDTFGAGIERLWWQKKEDKTYMSLGYRAGLLVGYCLQTSPKWDMYRDCDNSSKPFPHPMIQAFFDYTKDRIGVEVGVNPGFLNASMVIRF